MMPHPGYWTWIILPFCGLCTLPPLTVRNMNGIWRVTKNGQIIVSLMTDYTSELPRTQAVAGVIPAIEEHQFVPFSFFLNLPFRLHQLMTPLFLHPFLRQTSKITIAHRTMSWVNQHQYKTLPRPLSYFSFPYFGLLRKNLNVQRFLLSE